MTKEIKRKYGVTLGASESEKTVSVTEYKDSVAAEVPLTVTITDEDIDDILVSAFEGGINYWCTKVRFVGEPVGDCASEHVSRGGTVTLHDSEDDKDFELTRDGVIKGVLQYLVKPTSCDILEVVNHKLIIDTGYVDADVADSIVQYALFGDIVYA